MSNQFIKNAFVRFLIIAGLTYLSLYLAHTFIIKRYTYYDQKFIGSIIQAAENTLQILGFKTFTVMQDRDVQVVGIDGSTGVWVGSNCNAISLFNLFVSFVFAYPGKWKHKLWFIPAGILIIHGLNILRVVALSIISLKAPQTLQFNHTYTFTFFVYAFIFYFWMIWANKISKLK
jgi:exosortase family protein XrtF